jgi:hypothetical protein
MRRGILAMLTSVVGLVGGAVPTRASSMGPPIDECALHGLSVKWLGQGQSKGTRQRKRRRDRRRRGR